MNEIGVSNVPTAIRPGSAVRGKVDARFLLILWCARRAFFPLLWFGLAVASGALLLVRNVDADEMTAEIELLSSQGDLFGAILSPFAGIALAFFWRIGVAFVAFLAAYPLARGHRLIRTADQSALSYYFRTWWDRLFLTRAYRAVRWTWAVRVEAVALAPRMGRTSNLCALILRWLGWVLFVLWIGILVAAA